MKSLKSQENELFEYLTEDEWEGWLIYTESATISHSTTSSSQQSAQTQTAKSTESISSTESLLAAPTILVPIETTANCTMAFYDSCVDYYKCENACASLGASGLKWFHVGCCECVGKNCINFGVSETRCRNCPGDSDQTLDSGNPDIAL